ncbi:hypothetical protein PFICI_10587 [Pestalotiopsis fici W106-1]|uniref:Major facilitator superfamily (MFS) profile domain-containing protein n=1 Tax=Pestalotiopsis fici (strain W106-1 / CGMCC3.15140) TaxID=1229662 RepID=W3WXF0_PESFW|nr:uncharacterized protein PFICI_10587 [Pestalotiopsis fici W106-1]ETS78525.1 hypothetical protein PFICI_10587 [Pestalotiopsis fici W106-1]
MSTQPPMPAEKAEKQQATTSPADESSVSQNADFDYSEGASSEEGKKHLTRKLDARLIPTMMMMYLLSFLDRVNIGNARLYGLEEDLGLTSNQYQVCVSILFVTYCLFEVPSNLVLKKIRPHRYLAGLCFAWGILATLTGIVQGYHGLIAIRLVLGVVEAGLFPGMVMYLTMFYPRNQLAVRIGYLFIASAIAGAVGGMIAYGIGFMDDLAGLRAWRWLMILEGIPSVLLSIVVYLILPASLAEARFLTPQERDQIVHERHEEIGQTFESEKFHWKDVVEGILDWHVWVFSLAGFTNDIMFYGFSTFLPTIISSLGTWSTVESQALTVPVYALGTGVYIAIASFSDKKQRRGIYAAAFGCITLIGYIMLAVNKGPAVSYTGTFVVAAGLYVMVGLPLAWLPGNKPRYAKRALATGMQYTIGNTAGIAMPWLFRKEDAPKFRTGYNVSIAATCTSIFIFLFMSWYYRRVNKRRAEGLEDWKLEGKTEAEIQELGDWSPRYVYST